MKRLIWLVIIPVVLLFSCQRGNKSTKTTAKAQNKGQSVVVQETTTVDVHDTMPTYNNQPHQEKLSDYDYTAPYICPNHCPGSGSDKPGKCPVCGMDLIPNPDYQKKK